MKLLNYFIIHLLLTASQFAFGQIDLLNSSFENGHSDCSNTNIKQWNTCEIGIYNCIIDTIQEARPDSAVNGRFVAEVSADNNYYGSFSQYTPCFLRQGVTYHFNVYMASYIPTNNPTVFPYFSRGQVEIWIGEDTCKWQQMIFLSPLLDSVWANFTVTFTPNADYGYFFFRGHPPTTTPVLSTVMIDALSPISILNAHQIHSFATDTLLPIGSTACLNLNAYTDTTYQKVWWEQVGVGTIVSVPNAGMICTDSNATYIVHILGADSTCAGYLPSSDTVRVRFYDPNGITQLETAALLKIYPNPATNYVTITAEVKGTLMLHDGLGRLVVTKMVERGNNILNTEDLPSGVYFYRFAITNEIQQHGKLIKQ